MKANILEFFRSFSRIKERRLNRAIRFASTSFEMDFSLQCISKASQQISSFLSSHSAPRWAIIQFTYQAPTTELVGENFTQNLNPRQHGNVHWQVHTVFVHCFVTCLIRTPRSITNHPYLNLRNKQRPAREVR